MGKGNTGGCAVSMGISASSEIAGLVDQGDSKKAIEMVLQEEELAQIELAEAMLERLAAVPDRSEKAQDRSRWRQVLAKALFGLDRIKEAKRVLREDLADISSSEQQKMLSLTKLEALDPPTDETADGQFWKNQDGKLHREDGMPAALWFDGSKEWYVDGKWHREDGPAFICDGEERWYLNDELHREGGPARTNSEGREEWLIQGKFHREDGPALTYEDGSIVWYRQGVKHREGGPAYSSPDGQQEYYVEGLRHREGGPAVVMPDGKQEHWVNGQLHREDGPAIIMPDGSEFWYRKGKLYQTQRDGQISAVTA